MVAAAATRLKDKIEAAWNLTGELSKVSTGSGSTLMDEVVQFFDRAEVIGNEVTKAVTVEKINDESEEVVVKHPNFNEVSDIYEITVYWRVPDVEPSNFTIAIHNIEEMARETIKILKTLYDPAVSPPIGIYYRTSSSWVNEDKYDGNQPELRRKLRFQLTAITSDNAEAYTGLTGVLVFDTSASSGDSKPGADFTYAGVEGVKIREGFEQIPLLTKDVTKGVGVPFQTRGLFSGTFTAIMVAIRTNILGTTLDKLEKIYQVQSASNFKRQNAEVALLHTVNNDETLTNRVLKINVLTHGRLYNENTFVVIDPPTSGTTATAFPVIENFQVKRIVMILHGDGYTTVPNVQIIDPQFSGVDATAEAVLSTDGSTRTFTTQSFMKINNIFKDSMDDDLVKYVVTGTLTRPSVYTETPAP